MDSTKEQMTFQVVEVNENEDDSADIVVRCGQFVFVFGSLRVPDPEQSGFIDVDYDLSVALMHPDGSYDWLKEEQISPSLQEQAGRILESVIGEDDE